MADPDLQIRGWGRGGGGHPDPEIRGWGGRHPDPQIRVRGPGPGLQKKIRHCTRKR